MSSLFLSLVLAKYEHKINKQQLYIREEKSVVFFSLWFCLCLCLCSFKARVLF